MQKLHLWKPLFGLCVLLALTFSGKAQVTAGFTGTPQSGCSPLVVSFTDNSTGPVTTYFWDFGNGNTSTLQNPAAVYVNPGTYTVSLTVSDGTNNDTQTLTNYVTVFQNPTAGFTSTPPAGCAPLTVCFSDNSTPGDGTINQWLWDFGDGQNSTQQNPCHTYPNPGNYTVTLVVTDDNGCSNTTLITNYVSVSNTPTVAFTGSPLAACDPPLNVTFTNNSSGGQAPLTFDWDFGDGNSSTTSNPNHTYTASGTFDVTLIATDVNGCADTLVQPAYVNINNITADFTVDTTRTCEGQPVNFTDLSTGPPNTWLWDFGDGNTSTAQNPSHAYAASGTYTVTLIAGNGACADTITRPAFITVDPAPTADFVADTTNSCAAPLTVNFTDLSTGGAVAWDWDFGDGNTSTAQNPTHTYTAPGTYDVTLTVTSGSGCTNTITFNNYIQIVPPVADFVGNPLLGCIPLVVNFTDASVSNEPIVSWQWDFGDGNTSTAQNPSNTYTAAGTYTVTLIIVNSAGCTDTLVRPNYIQAGDEPVACFSNNPDTVCANTPVDFTDCSTNATAWFWQFGDGGTSTQQNPMYTYQDTGCFDVTLTAINFGCDDDTTITSAVCVLAPIARFDLNPTPGCAVPHTVFFTDQSIAPDTWLWDFGDGNTSTLQNPIHTYTAVGTYTVTLTVTDTINGCMDMATAQVDVSVPNADFGGTNLFGCGPLTVNFNDLSTGNLANIVAWDYDFGDGNTSTQQNPTHTYQNPGTYSVQLTVTDANGCTDILIRPFFVQVIGPDVNFGADILAGCIPTTVNFSDSTIPTAPIVSWTWDFGDGNTSNLQNPSNTYTAAGTYDVTLTVVDIDGCTRSFTRPAYINITDPTAAFTVGDTLTCTFNGINFNNNSTGSGLSYLWDFGDGNTSTATNPTHSYAANGTYTVTLEVTDVNGCMDTATVVNALQIEDVVANFGAAPTSASCPPLLVLFSDSSTFDITSWEWDFGDGTGSVLQNPSHVYATAGSFDVSLIVGNDDGCTDTLLVPGLVNIAGPNGSFTFAPDSGCTPLTVDFNANATNTALYTWDFGDGNVVITTADSVSHTYTQTGVFNPILILDDGLGCTFSLISPDSVVVDTVPFPAFVSDTALLCELDSVRFFDQTVSTRPIVAWDWDFGDGNTDTVQNPVHFYNSIGSYVVTLTVTNSLGCVNTFVDSTGVGVFNPPTAVINPMDTVGCDPFIVPFVDGSFGPQGIAGWDWDLGNGSTSTLQNPVGNYTLGGYVVSLIVTDSAGCTDTVTTTVNSFSGPGANFVANDTQGCVPLPVIFTADSSVGIVNWAWDFGDGTTTSGPVATVGHTYTTTGNFTVTLIVTDTLGCEDTLIRPQYININPPVADFNANVLVGCPGLTPTFTDVGTSVHPIVNWQWDFGDGTTALGNPVTHTYTGTGFYTVTLIVTDSVGCSDTLTRLNYIEVLVPPTAAIIPADTAGCAPFTVPFQDGSTGPRPITSFFWNFGFGQVVTQQNPTQTFTIPNNYTVTLVIVDSAGCLDTTTANVFASPGPSTNFVADDSLGCIPFPVVFSADSTPDIVNWNWDFGDGNNANGANATVGNVYQAAGSYTVSLIVTDTLGCEDTLVRPQYINIDPPTADFNANQLIGCPGLTPTFTDIGTSTYPIVAWDWDFGDGTTGTGNPATHTYTTPGLYTVTLIVTDSIGCQDTIVRPSYIEILTPPTAAINPTDTSGCAPFTVPFLDASTGPQAITAWSWDFGFGPVVNVQNPTQTFTTPGNYTVTLIVTDAAGCMDTITAPVFSSPGPTANFVADDSIGCPPHPVTFTADSSLAIVDWAWDFGDGTLVNGPNATVSHVYQGSGNFTVTLIVTDTLGCMDTVVRPQYININPPVADFSANVTSGCPALTVTFTDNSAGTNNIVAWDWDFGDGTTGAGTPVTHVYTTPGLYDVTLIVTDDQGCQDTLVRPEYIEVFEPPTALFGITDTIACTPFTIQLTDSSSGVAAVTGWDWDFGDGNTSTAQNPTNGYVTPGPYTISLIVTDANGCTDTTDLPFTVPVRPEANFISIDTLGCEPFDVDFLADSTDVVAWSWSFGDGNSGTGGPGITHFYGTAGTYDVQLITEDIYGCLDTLIRPEYIFIDSLRANFNIDNFSGCPPLAVNFTDQSLSDTTITAWEWDFGDGNTSTAQNPSHIYTTPGMYDVTLIVTNVIGCTDTITIGTIEVFDNIPPVVPPIRRATVLNNTTTDITWHQYFEPDFSHYVLYWEVPTNSNNWVPLDSFFTATDTSYNHFNLNTLNTPYCYKLQVVDICGIRSSLDSSQKHCTIDLEATPGIDEVNLFWTDYIGWDTVQQYNVYRVLDYGFTNIQLIGTVPGGVTAYTDTNATCYDIYCYRIEAIESGGFNEISWSDTSCARPIHIPFNVPMDLCAASVAQDSIVDISWFPPATADVVSFFVERSTDGQNWVQIAVLPPTATGYTDVNVNVQEQSYYYRVNLIDSCGDINPFSNVGRTILLDAEIDNQSPTLYYNPYEEWPFGIESYDVEVLNESTGLWELVETINGELEVYRDVTTNFDQIFYCYRIFANEAGGTCRSLSNTDCVPVGPRLYAPNAFTPNADGLNDNFVPAGIYIADYNLQIFDRWGALIFESNDLNDTWDGTYRGKPCQEGVFVWKIDARGFDDTEIKLTGTVTLYR